MIPKKFVEMTTMPVYGERFYHSGLDSRPKNGQFELTQGASLPQLIGGDAGSYGQEPGELDGVKISYVNRDGSIRTK